MDMEMTLEAAQFCLALALFWVYRKHRVKPTQTLGKVNDTKVAEQSRKLSLIILLEGFDKLIAIALNQLAQ